MIRFFTFMIVGVGSICLAGYLYLRQVGLDAKGTTIPQSIALAFVRRNMYRVAAAEREQVTVYSECFSMDQLLSIGKIGPGDQERSGYSFSISCDEGGADFTLTATHAPPQPGESLSWPVLSIDKSLAFHEADGSDSQSIP